MTVRIASRLLSLSTALILNSCAHEQALFLSSESFTAFPLLNSQYKSVQYFVSPGFSLRRVTEDRTDTNVKVAAGAIRSDTMSRSSKESIYIQRDTPVIAVEIGQDWIDVDAGDGITLRYSPNGDWPTDDCPSCYRLLAINGTRIHKNARQGNIVTVGGIQYRYYDLASFANQSLKFLFASSSHRKDTSHEKAIKGKTVPH